MKILYGVPGEGMGHATRSKVIITHLLKSHDVHIVSSSRAFTFLDKNFPGRVHEIKGFNFVYKDGKVEEFATFLRIFEKAPFDLIKNLGVYQKLHKEFVPDLVITDFETSASLFGQYLKVPVIDIDNILVIDRCKLDIDIPDEIRENYHLAKSICKVKVPGCDYFLISTFFHPEVSKENTVLIPPILRDEIIGAPTSQLDHVLVYQTSSSQQNLIAVLNELTDQTFFVYGSNTDEVRGNCVLKSFSEAGFISDLASAKAVITNGGYSLISEAVYLKKAVCSFPVAHQFEQFMNAAYIEKLNYGKHLRQFTAAGIREFLDALPSYQMSIDHYNQNGNVQTFEQLEALIASIKNQEKK